MTTSPAVLLRRIRWMVAIFIVGLVLSGLTAMPLETEIRWLLQALGVDATRNYGGGLRGQLVRVYVALADTNGKYPFMVYGYDWLAFGHIVIAVAFIGAWRNPVRNRWLFDFGLIACAMVVPFALVMGQVRGIPLPWRVIDCTFGIFGAVPMLLARRWTHQLAEADERA